MRVAWQSGVLCALRDTGLSFSHVDGASGGTITAAMLLSGLDPTEMVQRWDDLDVRDFASFLPLLDYLRGPDRLPALGDATGVRDRVLPHLGVDIAMIRDATARTGAVGTFNVCDFASKTCVAIPNHELALELLVAAVSLPLEMPAVHHGGRTYTDAVWIKDANVLEAVRRGATEIWLLWCIGNTARYGDGPFEQYVHMIEMSASGGLFAELAVVAGINARRRSGEAALGSTTPVVLHIVKPVVPLPLDPEFFLGGVSAATLVDMGHRDACAYLAAASADGVRLDESATAMTEPPLGVRLHERMHGTLEALGPVTLDLVVEVRDLEAFLADPAAPIPVVGHLDAAPGRLLLQSGSLRVTDAGAVYTLALRMSGAPTTLTCTRTGQGSVLGAWHRAGGLDVHDESGNRLGELRMSLRDAAAAVARMEPSGAHDLADRATAVSRLARFLFGQVLH